MTLTGSRKLLLTAILFAVAVGTVAIAAATHSYVPLFFTMVPLLAVTWVLVGDEPGEPEEAVSGARDRPADPSPAKG